MNTEEQKRDNVPIYIRSLDIWVDEVYKRLKRFPEPVRKTPEFLLLYNEWESLWNRKFRCAGDPKLLGYLYRDYKRKVNRELKKLPLIGAGVIALEEKSVYASIPEFQEKILTDDKELVSEKLRLNMTELTALTVYMLRKQSQIKYTNIGYLLCALRGDGKYSPRDEKRLNAMRQAYHRAKSNPQCRTRKLYKRLMQYVK